MELNNEVRAIFDRYGVPEESFANVCGLVNELMWYLADETERLRPYATDVICEWKNAAAMVCDLNEEPDFYTEEE